MPIWLQWLYDHWGYAVVLSVIAAVWKYRLAARSALLRYFGWQREISETQGRLEALTTRERDKALKDAEDLKAEREELRRVLREKIIDCDERDEINEQDRFTIRLLKTKLRENNVDFDDCDEAVRQWKKARGK